MRFFELLAAGVTRENIGTIFENVTIITFNYDRCIEHFLTHALANYFSIYIEDAKAEAKKLEIFHVYGQVGPYFGEDGNRVDFGSDIHIQPEWAKQNIKTFTEGFKETAELSAVKSAFSEAASVVFLGSHFHPQNLEVLKIPLIFAGPKTLFLTRKSISDEDLQSVKSKLERLCNGDIPPTSAVELRKKCKIYSTDIDQGCIDLFDRFQMLLRD